MEQALVPGLTLLISIGTVVYTQWTAIRNERRMEKIDDRAAAKDVVESMAQLNEAMDRQIQNLQTRVNALEKQHDDCTARLTALLVEQNDLHRQLADLKIKLSEARAMLPHGD